MIDDARWQRPNVFSLCFVGVFSIVAPAAAQTSAPLSSAAVDPSIYRDGEVKRFSSVHGSWVVVCDEVTRLKQRFCSLRTALSDSAGARAGNLTVSTGQDGRPAALLAMNAALIRGGWLEISTPTLASAAATVPATPKTAAQAKSKAPAAAAVLPTHLRPVSCDASQCTLIWTLKPEQIAAFNDGRGLQLAARPGPNLESATSFKPPTPLSILVSGDGFSDAVATSVKPFE